MRAKDFLRRIEELTQLLEPDLITMVSEIITEWVVWCPYMVKLGVYYFYSQAEGE